MREEHQKEVDRLNVVIESLRKCYSKSQKKIDSLNRVICDLRKYFEEKEIKYPNPEIHDLLSGMDICDCKISNNKYKSKLAYVEKCVNDYSLKYKWKNRKELLKKIRNYDV